MLVNHLRRMGAPRALRRGGGTRVLLRCAALLSTAVLLAGVSACATVSVRCGETCGQEYPPAGHEIRYDSGLIVSTYPAEWGEGKKTLRFRIDLRNSGAAPVPGGRVEVRLFETNRNWTLRQFTHDHSLDQAIPAGESVSGFVVLHRVLDGLDIEVMFRPRDGYEMAGWSVTA